MAEEKKQPDNEAALVRRLDEIEAKLDAVAELRKKNYYCSLVGVLLILTVLGLFVYRICAHVNQTYVQAMKDEEQRKQLMTELLNESKAQAIAEEQARLFVAQLQSDVLPELKDQFFKQLKEAGPVYEDAAMKMGDRLYKYMERHVEERLLETLTKSLEQMGEEVRKVFPDFTVLELEEQLEKAQALFIEKMHDAVEERLAKVKTSLDGLKSQVDKLSEEGGLHRSLEEAEVMFLEALIDLLVYELKPELGKEPAK